jgi:NADPH:quinone reductase
MTIPHMMHAVTIDQFGDAGMLKSSKSEVPKVGPGQVLIKLAYGGVGPWDRMDREGMFSKMTGTPGDFPMTLGCEGAGTIAAVGPDVDTFRQGDRVYALTDTTPKGGGFNADYVAVSAANVSLIPDGLSLETAGAMPLAALTALQGIQDALRLKKDESLLVFGASGDLGMMAVQFARRMGARVLALASGNDGVAAVRELGADVVIDGTTGDVAGAAKSFAPEGLDAIIAFAGGPALDVAIGMVRDGGRLAYPLGVDPAPAARPDVNVVSYVIDLAPGALDKLNQAINSAPFTVRVAQRYSLNHAADAQRALARHHVGKIVLQIANEG